MANEEPLILSIDLYYKDEPVKILNPKIASPGIFEAFIHPVNENTKLESGVRLFNSNEIALPNYHYLEASCKNASKNILLALFIRANSIRESIEKNIDELNTAFIIEDGNIIDIINSEASNGYDDFFMHSFNKMQSMNADWGIFTEFGTDNTTNKQGIIVEIGHPEFGRVFITSVAFNKELNSINVNIFDTKLIQEGAGAQWK